MTTHITDYFEKTVSMFPEKIAIKDAMGDCSFLMLLQEGKKVASRLLMLHVSKQPIPVYMPKSKNAIATFLGINYSGNFYVPLDVKSPKLRIQSILEVLESEVIITDKAHEAFISEFFHKEVLVFEDICRKQVINAFAIESIVNHSIDTDPMYCIFTSGSTGTPKGVVISHRGVMDYIDWAVNTFKVDETSIIGNQAPFYFDNSTLDIYLMYSTGATLVIIPEELYTFPSQLIDYMNDNRVNFVFWVPFVLIHIANLNILATKKPEYLESIFFAGEVMPNKHLNYWRSHLPHCSYANLYGPTEITVDCTWYKVERAFTDDESLPIGFPCKNSDVLILTENDELAGIEEQGELCVRGTSLALGYYNDWEKTLKTFVQNPLNKHYPERIYRTGDLVYKNKLGEILFVGRKDSQIKHLGYRIELGEIETAAIGTHLVDICSVIYDNKNKQIIMFYEAKSELSLSDFRKSILLHIPKYMIPTVCSRVSKIACNANGKIDRLYYQRQINE